jgi:glycosyltransferase involved in cell wall biosynthesis
MLKIAIVHDYLIDFGGAERVLLVLHEIYPDAPIYVSIYRKNRLGKFADKFKNAKIIQSWFGQIPFADKLISPFRFLMPATWRSLNLTKYDLIISSASWAVTKGFEKKSGAKEICYCHTPPRYLYGYDTSRRFDGFMGQLVRFYGLIVNHFMRQYDFKQAQKVDYFIANSKEVASRIEKFYRRDSVIIYPPVDVVDTHYVQHVHNVHDKNTYYLTGGRLTAAKNFDLIIKTFNKLGLSLKIYGSGPLENQLKKIAKDNIEFLGNVEDEEMAELYSGAKAFILAQKDEDFGMTSVESMSYGTPVIAYRGGGYVESVIENKTGIFFDDLTIENLSKTIKSMNQLIIKPEDCINQAKKFSTERFKDQIVDFVTSVTKLH